MTVAALGCGKMQNNLKSQIGRCREKRTYLPGRGRGRGRRGEERKDDDEDEEEKKKREKLG